jgi:hypothetical protein
MVQADHHAGTPLLKPNKSLFGTFRENHDLAIKASIKALGLRMWRP